MNTSQALFLYPFAGVDKYSLTLEGASGSSGTVVAICDERHTVAKDKSWYRTPSAKCRMLYGHLLEYLDREGSYHRETYRRGGDLRMFGRAIQLAYVYASLGEQYCVIVGIDDSQPPGERITVRHPIADGVGFDVTFGTRQPTQTHKYLLGIADES